jgi:hypothetical protein
MITNASYLHTVFNIGYKLTKIGSLIKTISCCYQYGGLHYYSVASNFKIVPAFIFIELECEAADWIQLDHPGVQRRTLVNITSEL